MKLKSKIFCHPESRVVFNQKIAEGRYLLRIEVPEVARIVSPGQFIQVKLDDFDPLLPRPFAISYVDKEFIDILYEVRGKGTGLLSRIGKGEQITLIGPLGNGFTLPASKTAKLVLVAGGIGLAPLRFLAWKAVNKGYHLVFLYGDKNQKVLLPIKDLLPDKSVIYSITEEGKGKTGLVTDLLKEVIEDFNLSHFYVCGPRAMLKEVQLQFAKKNIVEAQFSFEERMGCGYGACLGCAIPTKNGYQRVCREGPVFKAEEIEWESV